MKICAIIPVYNNVNTIRDVVLRCRKVIEPDIFVVSDGSTDSSDEVAENAGAQMIRLKNNHGKGHAIRHGLKVTAALGFTHAIVLDGDGQHFPEEIPQFLSATWDCPDRIWCGQRDMTLKEVPKSSRFGRLISNFWATIIGWRRCRDAQCGYRVYPIKPTLALDCKEDGFAFELEVLIRASWAGMELAHRPITVHYPKPADRVTHFDMRKDNLKFSWLSFKLFWGMMLRLPLLLSRRLRRL